MKPEFLARIEAGADAQVGRSFENVAAKYFSDFGLLRTAFKLGSSPNIDIMISDDSSLKASSCGRGPSE